MNHEAFAVDFPFRAHRDYVHSTSLCNHFAQRFGRCERFELVLRSWMRSRVIFTPVDAVRPGSGAGHAKLLRDGTEAIWELSEDEAHPVSAREPYDEDALASAEAVEDRTLACAPDPRGTFFDRLISANKVLIGAALKPQARLVAAKIVTKGFPADDAPFSVALASHVGERIFKSRVIIGGGDMGEVVFYGQQ